MSSQSTDADADDPQSFYDAYGSDEWDRLESSVDGRLEFDVTIETLEAHLPPSGRVLDAGGGAGRYSIWLAERGYDVTLVDLSRGQLDVAREMVADRGVESNVTLSQGTITDLGLAADAFDATCCLGGPLSHVLEADARARAVRELRRVSAPGAPVFVSVMGLLGALQLYLVTGHNLEALPDLLERGDYDSRLLERYGYENEFTATHFFRREGLVDLLSENGLEVVETSGLEGIASPLHDAAIRENATAATDAERRALERIVHRTSDEPAVTELSIHMLAVGTA